MLSALFPVLVVFQRGYIPRSGNCEQSSQYLFHLEINRIVLNCIKLYYITCKSLTKIALYIYIRARWSRNSIEAVFR